MARGDDGNDERRCKRCWNRYRESENHVAACWYHPGRLKDYDRYNADGDGFAGDFWDCCSYVMATEQDRSHGCVAGRHDELDGNDLGPLGRRYEAQMRNEAAVIDAYQQRVGGDALGRVQRVRRLLEEFLAGLGPDGLGELEEEDVAVLEGPILGWLIARIRDRQYPAARREAAARVVRDPDMRCDLLRLVQ
jgi:hypothetical protein